MSSPTDPLPPRPQPPRDEDCCRSDCPNCVFNLFERELERWQQRVDALNAEKEAASEEARSGKPQPGER